MVLPIKWVWGMQRGITDKNLWIWPYGDAVSAGMNTIEPTQPTSAQYVCYI